jgi:hypothetical protein
MATDFGRDTSCTASLLTGRFSVGAKLVGEAAYRRLTTPRGMLRGGEVEANYGLDILDLIGSVATKADAAALPGRIRAELQKDERIARVDVTVTPTLLSGGAVAYDIAIDADTALGPFALVLRVTDVTVEVLGLTVGS